MSAPAEPDGPAAKSQLRRGAESLLYSGPSVGLFSWLLSAGRRAPLKTVLILSHMRSGSSLLVHLLNTNPEVFGFGETFLTYERPEDLRRLPLKMFARTRKILWSETYAVDKILHRRLLPNPQILQHPDVRTIFLVRGPDSSLQSLIHAPSLPGWWQQPDWSREGVDQNVVADYYCGRLDTLNEHARAVGRRDRSLFLTYEQIVSRTPDVFAAFQQLLGVEGSFSEDYQVLDTTGKPGMGDPSEYIKKGYIDRKIQHSRVAVRDDVTARAREGYERCCAALRDECSVVPDEDVQRSENSP